MLGLARSRPFFTPFKHLQVGVRSFYSPTVLSACKPPLDHSLHGGRTETICNKQLALHSARICRDASNQGAEGLCRRKTLAPVKFRGQLHEPADSNRIRAVVWVMRLPCELANKVFQVQVAVFVLASNCEAISRATASRNVTGGDLPLDT